jgi:hypothetical protein
MGLVWSAEEPLWLVLAEETEVEHGGYKASHSCP